MDCFRFVCALALVVMVGMVTCEGLKIGDVCEKTSDCGYTGGVCAMNSGCKKGNCICDVHKYYVKKISDKDGYSCIEADERKKGDTCKPGDADSGRCEGDSKCTTCPKGDPEHETNKCRSDGSVVVASLPLLLIAAAYNFFN